MDRSGKRPGVLATGGSDDMPRYFRVVIFASIFFFAGVVVALAVVLYHTDPAESGLVWRAMLTAAICCIASVFLLAEERPRRPRAYMGRLAQ